MGGDYLKVDHWPETLSTPVCTTKVCPAATHKGFLPGITCTSVMRPDLQGTQQPSKDVLWEDLLDYSEIEAEEDFLQQHIALLVSDYKIVLCLLLVQVEIIPALAVLTVDNVCTSCLSVVQNVTWVLSTSPYHLEWRVQMVPNMQYNSLEALSAPDNDLLILTGTGLWDPLRNGLMFCLTSNNKQIIALATKLIANVQMELSKAGYYECIGQLVCSIGHAAEQAASMRQCVAIWEPCMPIIKAVAHQLPQTCMYYTEAVLGNIAEAFCSLLRICMESNHASLRKSLTSNNDNEFYMRWWHSWLARAKIAKVNDP